MTRGRAVLIVAAVLYYSKPFASPKLEATALFALALFDFALFYFTLFYFTLLVPIRRMIFYPITQAIDQVVAEQGFGESSVVSRFTTAGVALIGSLLPGSMASPVFEVRFRCFPLFPGFPYFLLFHQFAFFYFAEHCSSHCAAL